MKSKAQRLISGGTNFILKGGGWYSDLYSSHKASAAEPSPSKPAATTEAGTSAAKTDSKVATTAAAAPATPT